MATIAFPNVIDLSSGAVGYPSAAPDLGLDVPTTNDIQNGSNDSDFLVTGKELLVVYNQSGSPINLLLTSVADSSVGRVTSPNPLSIAIPAGDTRIIGPFARNGWAASNGRMKMQASAAALRAALVRFPTIA